MSHHGYHEARAIIAAIRESIETRVAQSEAEVSGGAGHYMITVRSPAFNGKSMLESHRLVYSAIEHLMSGADAPVHAVDKLQTLPT